MLTGKHIREYIFLNFSRLYKTDADTCRSLFDVLPRDVDYKLILDEIIRNPAPVMVNADAASFPVFYHHTNENRIGISGLTMEELLVNAFLLLTGWQENVIIIRDQYGRFPFNESLQSKFSFHLVPIVNFLFEEISRRINESGFTCLRGKFSRKGSNIVFSHDIDRIYSGWYEGTGNLLRKPGVGRLSNWMKISYAKFVKNEDDYQAGFSRLLSLIRKRRIKSIFFFLANKSAKDADYNLSDPFIRNTLIEIFQDGHLAGIHLGFDTYQAPGLMKTQIRDAESVFGRNITHNRQHFLRYDIASTPANLISSGIEYDYSLGFAESPGFRNSIASPFYSFSFKSCQALPLVEVPLFFMDGTYSHYQKNHSLKMSNPLEALEQWSETFNMNISVLFHNSVFTDFKYEGFTGLFERMTDWCSKKDFSTDAQIVWPET